MKYNVVATSAFQKELKIIKKRNKDIEKIRNVVNTLSKGEKLDESYRNHS